MSCRLAVQKPQRGIDGRWVYPPLAYAMMESVLQKVDTYVSRFHSTVAQFIATRPIMDLCMAVERRPGSRISKRCWNQEVLDLEGMRTAAQEVERE